MAKTNGSFWNRGQCRTEDFHGILQLIQFEPPPQVVSRFFSKFNLGGKIRINKSNTLRFDRRDHCEE